MLTEARLRAAPNQELAMTTNVGFADRVVRVVIGLALLSLLFLLDSGARWFGLIGLLPIGTALIGWCPAYTPFGIHTGARHGRAKA